MRLRGTQSATLTHCACLNFPHWPQQLARGNGSTRPTDMACAPGARQPASCPNVLHFWPERPHLLQGRLQRGSGCHGGHSARLRVLPKTGSQRRIDLHTVVNTCVAIPIDALGRTALTSGRCSIYMNQTSHSLCTEMDTWRKASPMARSMGGSSCFSTAVRSAPPSGLASPACQHINIHSSHIG